MKSTIARLFSPSYLWNTVRIKWKARLLASNTKGKPYQQFREVKKIAISDELTTSYSDFYTSFGYLDYKTAETYYADRPSTIHQIMLAIIRYNEGLATNERSDSQVSWILAQAEEVYAKATKVTNYITFLTEERYDRFDLEGERYSGIVQAKAASLFIRCYRLSQDKKYLTWARESLQACTIDVADKGVCRTLDNETIWVEEYTSPTPSMVLNGFGFVVIALAEYCTTTKDQEMQDFYHECLSSLITWLPHYRVGNDMLYSMYHWSLCNVHYQGVVKYQMDHLYGLTGIEDFKKWADFLGGRVDWALFKWLFR